jgi:hypothetical protein
MNQQAYEQELAERQRKHYEEIEKHAQPEWKPCLDDECPTCHGTMLKLDGSPCIHYHRCDCSKCRERPSFKMSEFFLKQDIRQLTPCIGTPMP